MNKKIDWKNMIFKRFPGKNQWLIVLLVGILLAVIALPTTPKGNQKTASLVSDSNTTSQDENYEMKAEKKLESVLQNMEGVGEVTVMITLKASAEKVVEKDVEKSSQSEESEDGTAKSVDSSLNETTVYDEQSGSGQTPYISKEVSPLVEGVLVIADGGGNPVVVRNITEAIQALFNVEMHKIKVMKRNQEN